MTNYFKKYEVFRTSWDGTFAGLMSTVVKKPEDLDKPLKQLLCEYIDVIGKDKELLLHLKTGTPADLSAPVKYGRVNSVVFELKEDRHD
jgi:hypothetical protein